MVVKLKVEYENEIVKIPSPLIAMMRNLSNLLDLMTAHCQPEARRVSDTKLQKIHAR
jgi:hypothetical protein